MGLVLIFCGWELFTEGMLPKIHISSLKIYLFFQLQVRSMSEKKCLSDPMIFSSVLTVNLKVEIYQLQQESHRKSSGFLSGRTQILLGSDNGIIFLSKIKKQGSLSLDYISLVKTILSIKREWSLLWVKRRAKYGSKMGKM